MLSSVVLAPHSVMQDNNGQSQQMLETRSEGHRGHQFLQSGAAIDTSKKILFITKVTSKSTTHTRVQ